MSQLSLKNIELHTLKKHIVIKLRTSENLLQDWNTDVSDHGGDRSNNSYFYRHHDEQVNWKKRARE